MKKNSLKKNENGGKNNDKPKYEIAYICTGKNPECKKYSCYYKENGKEWKGWCEHTTDIRYAAYKLIKDHPANYPERFECFRCTIDGERVLRYYEIPDWRSSKRD